tara:strand:- start:3111 stop:3656 length:546 start_codon:yes stop_codon:yes gene_type:complete
LSSKKTNIFGQKVYNSFFVFGFLIGYSAVQGDKMNPIDDTVGSPIFVGSEAEASSMIGLIDVFTALDSFVTGVYQSLPREVADLVATRISGVLHFCASNNLNGFLIPLCVEEGLSLHAFTPNGVASSIVDVPESGISSKWVLAQIQEAAEKDSLVCDMALAQFLCGFAGDDPSNWIQVLSG